jgi:hypothetical protein
MKFDKPHFCPDWDFMLLVPGCPELGVCNCGNEGRMIRAGDRVKTNYINGERNRIRTVRKCAPGKGQTGYWIATTDGLCLDSAWFQEP